jgi:tRNA pseudouridine38-40 synthase
MIPGEQSPGIFSAMTDSPAPPPLPTRRVALLLEYDGTAYRGLQAQSAGHDTIQGRVEAACRALGSTEVGFVAAGRTDAGVHAVGQVVAVSLPVRLEERRIIRALNACLPPDIRVRRAVHCADSFSPRHDAEGRYYIYRLAAGVEVPPLLRHSVAFSVRRLDRARTMAAAAAFVGRWELAEWRSADCQATRTFLTIRRAEAIPPDPDALFYGRPRVHWEFHFEARSFLHHQVRFMVGAITAVGSGKLEVDELKRALAEGRRPARVMVEPACGLTLTGVSYPPERDPFSVASADQQALSTTDGTSS